MPVDFSQITGPTHESGTNRGMSFFANALDAVLQRRAAMQRQEQELEAQAAQAKMVDSRTREMNAATAEHQRALETQAREETERKRQHDAHTEQISEQARRATAIKDALPMFATPGQESAGLARLQADRVGIAPKAVDSGLMQPIDQPEHTPDAPGGGADWGAQAFMESKAQTAELERRRQLEQAQAQAKGKYTLDFGSGPTQDIDVRAMGPAGQADRIASILPSLDPVDAANARRIMTQQQAGMLKPEAGAGFLEAGVARRENNAAAMDRARVNASARDKIDQGEAARLKLGQVGRFEGAYKNWEDAANVKNLTDAKSKADEASGLAEQFRINGSSVAQRAALYQTARAITGPGVLTENEFKNTVTNSTGILGLLTTQAGRFANGEISDQEMKALEQYLKDAQEIIKRKAGMALKNYDKKFAKSYYQDSVPEEVAAGRQALIDRFGLSKHDEAAAAKGKTTSDYLTDEILKGAAK